MAADGDGLDPSRNGLGDALEDDGLAEDSAAENVADLRGTMRVRREGEGGDARCRWGSATSA